MKKLITYIFLIILYCSLTQASSLPPCKGSDDTKWTNCYGKYLKKEILPGITRDYTGEFGNIPGKRHGKGTSKTYRDGKLAGEYIGEFKNDRSHGQGIAIMENGKKYDGEWKNGKRHGQGTFTHTDGYVEKGIWENGKLVKKTNKESKDEIKKYLYTNMLNDTIDCWSFYMIMIRDFELKDPNDPVLEQLNSGRNKSYSLYVTFLLSLGMTRDEGSEKLQRVLKSKGNISAKELINDYGKLCLDLTNDHEARSKYWLNKYKS